MPEIKNSGVDNYEIMEKIISYYNLSGQEVLDLLTDWHGLQLLSKGFIENLIDCEGYKL